MTTLRLTTYNIRLGIQLGVPAVAVALDRLTPDLVALQEVGQSWTMGPPGDTSTEIAAALGHPHHIYVTAIWGEDGANYGHALMSAHPLEPIAYVDLPRAIDEPRVLLHARLVHPIAGPVEVLSTHLSYKPSERPAQGEVLADLALGLHARGSRVLILGDLNEERSPPWMERLREVFHGADDDLGRPTYPSSAPRIKLDYILTNSGALGDPIVTPDAKTSDHFPLSAKWDI